jgi:hypothetical protein
MNHLFLNHLFGFYYLPIDYFYNNYSPINKVRDNLFTKAFKFINKVIRYYKLVKVFIIIDFDLVIYFNIVFNYFKSININFIFNYLKLININFKSFIKMYLYFMFN